MLAVGGREVGGAVRLGLGRRDGKRNERGVGFIYTSKAASDLNIIQVKWVNLVVT